MPESPKANVNDEDRTSVSGSLKRAIKDSGIAISELARRTGVARQAINRFLSGERGLTTETVDKLCGELGLALLPAGPTQQTTPDARPIERMDHARQRNSQTLDLLRCKYFLSKINDRHPLAYNPIWSDLLREAGSNFPLYALLQEVRGFGSDKQRAAMQCLILSIVELNPNKEELLNNEHLPGVLRHLVTQDDDPICLGSLGAILTANDVSLWFYTLPEPEPDPDDGWVG